MPFEVIGNIKHIQTIAHSQSIREIHRLNKFYGKGRWRKLKGVGKIRLDSGRITSAELHWYECHGVGKRELKIKKLL